MVGNAVGSNRQKAEEALGNIFEGYRRPLYSYLRRVGQSSEDAEDLLQGFFLHLIKKNGLLSVDREKGRFRSFLLSSLKNYAISEWHRGHTQKRGGGAKHLSLDLECPDTGLKLEPEDGRSPDRWFDREWAKALVDRVLEDLEREEPEFARWKPFLAMNGGRLPYAEMAARFGISEGAARVAVHRLRKRYRHRLREEIAGTLTEASMVDDEIRFLQRALREDF